MIAVCFYKTSLGEEDKCIATYTGRSLNFTYDDIFLDGEWIAIRRRRYDFDYFILKSDYDKSAYDDERWLSRMTVEVLG